MAALAHRSAWLLPRPGRHWGARAALLALLCVATMHAALAADGRALVASGAVALERPQAAPVPVAAGTEFERGDLIRTGSDGRVQIRFTDGSIVSLQPGTAFRIDDYRFDATGQRGFFFLVRGALRTITGAIG
ncbi:MAG TPA: FecR family protein, partial [Zeimonas sp.]|nr:FecR family protein [Zeimonas sp.]